LTPGTIERVLSLHEEIQFRDAVRARPEIEHLEKLPLPALRVVKALLPLLPNPDDSVHFLNRLMEEAPDRAFRFWQDPTALRYALTIFSYSHFLSDAVIRYPDWLLEIAAARDLHRGFLPEEYEERLVASLPADGLPRPVDLALFRRRQILRIVLRDILRFADVSETAEDLSNLADAILNVTWRAIRRELSREPGSPRDNAFSVIALGKLGGKELNYSSDIDLLFVYSGDGITPAGCATTKEFFKRAANMMTEMLSTYTPEGMCYRVDLRLRPDGSLGEVCQSLEGAKQYYATRGRDWELQMLIKARVAAGDARPGRELLEFVEPLIYKTTTDFSTVEAVSETRARIHEKQARRERHARPGKRNTVDVKLAKGGIRDIEFLVQCLQRLHGGREPWVRHGGTLLALSRLRDKEWLSSSEYSRLASAYQFMRNLEHRLQFDDDRQIHALPRDKDQLDLLAQKMPQSLTGGLVGLPSAGTLERELDRHFSGVQDLYDRVIHSQRPIFYSALEPVAALPEMEAPEETPVEVVEVPERGEFPSVNLKRYLDLRAPALCRLVSNGGIRRNQDNMESFLDKVLENSEWLRMLEDNDDLARGIIDIFEHSQYLADQLVRYPDLIYQVEQACCNPRQGRTGFDAPREPVELRRFFREQMVRIQADSIYHRVSVFRTLKRTSDLAGSVVAAAYDIALADALAMAPPASGDYRPSNQLTVVALGRLGMREFDLASDADLIFVIPDADASETLFWTGVAERLINVISSYTGDGVVFTIDTRLRPNGREGALVQTEGAYKEYFALHAEAWEGIAYMKARGVAGNVERATAFLNELQQIDWRRYGQSGRSRTELSHMRSRLEREQGGRNPLKAGPGGYYDIDFVLMYLRLRGAGLFFKVLNTPARIEIIEKMGHIDRVDAEFLTNAATFYRAIDHGMRVSTGQAEGRLPTNAAQIAVLSELVGRWAPAGMLDGTLETVTKRVRRDTRAFFQRIFGSA